MFEARISQLRELLEEENVEAFLTRNPIDIEYLTGLQVSEGSVIISRSEAYFLLDARYYEMGTKRSPISVILSKKDSLKSLFSERLKDVKTLGVPDRLISYKDFQELSEALPVKIKGISNSVMTLREIKDEEELERLIDAANLGSKGYDFVLTLLKEGVTEIEVAKELEIFWLKEGGNRLAFDPIIAFGVNTSMPHYRPSSVVLNEGDPVLIDIGIMLRGYHSDMTRVVFFKKEPSQEMKKIYSIVKEAQERALEVCRPGTRIGDVDEAARGYITQQGYGDYFTHGLGHGIGLEIHEAPVVRNQPPHGDKILMPGMVITIEPGIYLPDLGGVRIEDTIVITKNKYKNLTERSKNIEIIS
ncbi:MAG: Xaa-Pro peptidase family protein [Chlamydiales bacterium]